MKRSKMMIEERLSENGMELEYEKNVRNNLNRLMNAKGKTQADIAEIMCCSKSHVNDLLSGKSHFYVYELELLANDLNSDEFSFQSFFCKPDSPELMEKEVQSTFKRMGVPEKDVMKIISIFVNALKEILEIIRK